jgi:hypothetical protein
MEVTNMRFFTRISASVVLLAFACGAVASAEPQCPSNANVGYVHRRLDGAIEQLQHDDRDYGGHRVAALNDLNAARADLAGAERYAVRVYGDNPACFRTWAATGGSPFMWGVRSQTGSNRDMWGVRRWIGDLEGQLQADNRDYGGRKAAAISRLQAAQWQLIAAERYAQSNNY